MVIGRSQQKARQPLRLPAEILDLILDRLFRCPHHRWASRQTPCHNWHSPTQLPAILPLRHVCRYFNERITPAVFHHTICKGRQRHQTLKDLSRHDLSSHIRVLRLEFAPEDFGSRMRRVTVSAAPVDSKLAHYFEVLPIYLAPILKCFRRVQILQVATTYAGILASTIPKNEAMDPCLYALARCVKRARLADLEEITFGVPYLGGYTNFFADIDERKHGAMLKACGKNLRTASVKLFDHQGNFTTMPFF